MNLSCFQRQAHRSVLLLLILPLLSLDGVSGGRNQTIEFRFQVLELERSLQRADVAQCQKFLAPASRILVAGREVHGCLALIQALGVARGAASPRFISLYVEHGVGTAVLLTRFSIPGHTIILQQFPRGVWKAKTLTFNGDPHAH